MDMTENQLFIFLDTESIDNTYFQNKNNVDRILFYDKRRPFVIERSSFKPKIDAIAKIPESNFDSNSPKVEAIGKINTELFKKSLTDGEVKFLHLILKHGSTHTNFNRTYIDNAVFITENDNFLQKLLST